MRYMLWAFTFCAAAALAGCGQPMTNRGGGDTGAPRTANKPVIDDRATTGAPTSDRAGATENNPSGMNMNTPPGSQPIPPAGGTTGAENSPAKPITPP